MRKRSHFSLIPSYSMFSTRSIYGSNGKRKKEKKWVYKRRERRATLKKNHKEKKIEGKKRTHIDKKKERVEKKENKENCCYLFPFEMDGQMCIFSFIINVLNVKIYSLFFLLFNPNRFFARERDNSMSRII